jgi:tetratricopeptide (TPR) repeat protein
MSPLTRRFAAPSPGGRGATPSVPLPAGEGGAKRRVRGVLLAILFLATAAHAQYVPPVLKGIKGEGEGRRALKPIPFPAADEKWILARSKHFVFISSAGEKRIRDVAAGLETLAAALTQMSPRFSSTSAETHVFLFSRHREAQPYFDLLIGRENAHVTGVFVSQNDRGAMVMETGFTYGPDRTPFHELIHYLIRNGGTRPPLWLEEGLAEYFSNAQMRKGAVYAGEPVAIHLQVLRQRNLIPLPQLLSVGRESDLYNLSDSQKSFYAQSWAIVDWLLRQNPAAFDDFLRDIDEGKTVEQALRARYHKSNDDMTQAFDVGFGRPAFGITLPVANADTSVVVTPIDRSELLYQLGKFLSGVEEGGPNAERHFREALVINPAHPRSLAALGDYEKAIAADPKDADLYLEYAESLLGKEIGPLAEADPPSPDDAAKFRKVRELAHKAVDLGGDPGRAYGDLGTTYMVEKDADLAAGISALEKSRALLPGRLDYGVHLFTMYRRVGNRAKADPLFIELDRARNPQVAYAMRATIMRVELAHANLLVQQQKLDEAAAVIRDLADNTSDSDAKRDLVRQAEEITRAAAANREIEAYNKAVGQVNRGEYKKALKTLDQLLLTATDAGVIRDAKKLQAQLSLRGKI